MIVYQLDKDSEFYLLPDKRGILIKNRRALHFDASWGQLFSFLAKSDLGISLDDSVGSKIPTKMLAENILTAQSQPKSKAPPFPLSKSNSSLSAFFLKLFEASPGLETSSQSGFIALEEGFDASEIEKLSNTAIATRLPYLVGWRYKQFYFIKLFQHGESIPCCSCILGRFISNIHLSKLDTTKTDFPQFTLANYSYVPARPLTLIQKLQLAVQAVAIWYECDCKDVWVVDLSNGEVEKIEAIPLPYCSSCWQQKKCDGS